MQKIMNYSRLAAMSGMFGGLGRVFKGTPHTIKPKAKLFTVLSITPGKSHAWCDSDQGRIRKPIGAIPKNLMAEYANSHTMI
jgi:hypothetical protein